MTRVTVDSQIGEILLKAVSPLEVCDSSGKVIGTFTPAVDLAALEAEEPVDYDELERRLQEGPFVSTTKLFARLGLS